MEISFLCLITYTVFSCIIGPSQSIKTFSLNDAIAAEAKQRYKTTDRLKTDSSTLTPTETKYSALNIKPLKQSIQPARTFFEDKRPERVPFFQLREAPRRISRLIENITQLSISPLTYRKTFQIKSPLRPRQLKYSYQPRYKRKNQSISQQNDAKQEYVPLVKNIRLLFDNLLNTDTSGSNEVNDPDKGSGEVGNRENACTCSNAQTKRPGSKTEEEAITSASTITAKIAPTTSSKLIANTTNTAANSDISTFRKNKILPILLARNTTGSRRNYNGIGKRRGTSLHRSIQRHITRPHGDSKRYSNKRSHDPNEKNNAQTARSHPRNGAGSTGLIGKTRRVTNSTKSDEDEKFKTSENPTGDSRGNIHKSKRQNKLEAERIDAANPVYIREPNGQWDLSENKINDNPKSVQSEEISEKGDIYVTNNSTSNKRISDRNGTFPAEVQSIRPTNETIMLDNLPFKTEPIERTRNTPGVVIIIDGYSIARNINGEDSVAKKAVDYKQ